MNRRLPFWFSLLLPFLLAFQSGELPAYQATARSDHPQLAPTDSFPIEVEKPFGKYLVSWTQLPGDQVSYYLVEREDETHAFQLMGGVKAVQPGQPYVYQDLMQPLGGWVRFRVIAVLTDGSKIFSRTVTFQEPTQSPVKVVSHPNQPEKVWISLPEPLERGEVKLYDGAGNLVKEASWYGQEQALDVHSLPSGLYFVRILSERQQWSGKLLHP